MQTCGAHLLVLCDGRPTPAGNVVSMAPRAA
jgi:hypothetical protein